MPNKPFYSNPGSNPYAWNNNFAPGASYAPQTGSYMAGNQITTLTILRILHGGASCIL